MTDADDPAQQMVWSALYDRIRAVLIPFGTEDHFGNADYLLVDDNYGHRRHTIEIHKLRMLDRDLVRMLRMLLAELPDWEIVIALDVPGTEKSWPRMGLIIRSGEVVDGLQRGYLPPQFQKVVFEGSRTGTGYD
ncbi:MAG: hypothetical protein WCE79_20725 [Xanthobacteraceae bacterium]